MKLLIYVSLFLTILGVVSGDIIISEIYYNPDGTDSGNEWIEIYNNGDSTNLSTWKFFENEIKHNLIFESASILEKESFGIISDNIENFKNNYPEYNGLLIKSTFSLKNTGEVLSLLNQNLTTVFKVTYNTFDNYPGTEIINLNEKPYVWDKSIGTPGSKYIIINDNENNITQDYENSTNQDTNNETNFSNNNEIINENNEILDCTISLNIETEKKIYENGETIEFYNKLSDTSYDFIIEYWIEDLYGKILKEKRETKNLAKKTFTPKNKDEKTIVIKSTLKSINCNNKNENNDVEHLVIVKKPENEIILNFSEDINLLGYNFYDNFIEVKLKVVKGNSKKSKVEIYIKNNEKKISEISNFDIYSHNIELKINVPVLLNDCVNKNKTYIIINGLGISKNEMLIVPEKNTILCKNNLTINKNNKIILNDSILQNNKSEIVEKIFSEPIIKHYNENLIQVKEEIEDRTFDEKISGKVIYESKNKKSKDYSIIFLTLSILFAAFVLKKLRE